MPRHLPTHEYPRGQRVTLTSYFGTPAGRLHREAREGATSLVLTSVAGVTPGARLLLSAQNERIAEVVVVASVATLTRTVTLASGLLYTHPLDPTAEVDDAVLILADPDAPHPTFEVMRPDGTVTSHNRTTGTPTVALVAAGEFTLAVTLNAPGDWFYRSSATGAIETARWRRLSVEEDSFA